MKVKDLVNNAVLEPEVFDYVVVATGHYSTPHVPHFEVITVDDKFSLELQVMCHNDQFLMDVNCEL